MKHALRTLTAAVALATSLPAAAQIPTQLPGGRLTLATGTPVMTADTTSATLYYTPYLPGFPSTELSVSLALLPAGAIFDVFTDGISSVCLGSQWANANTRTDALTRVSGVLVGPSPCGSQGTYLGTVQIDPTPGQITANFSYGLSRRFGVWNAYNQKRVCLRAGEPGHGNYVVGSPYPNWIPLHSDAGNSLSILLGLAEEPIEIKAWHTGYAHADVTNRQGYWAIAVGWNSTTTPSGFWGQDNTENLLSGSGLTGAIGVSISEISTYTPPLFQGAGVATALETSLDPDNLTKGFYGETVMMLQACWSQ